MNTVYNTLLTRKIGIVSGDLHNVYVFTHKHTQSHTYILHILHLFLES